MSSYSAVQLSADAIGERVATFLRRLYPANTAANVAADTGLTEAAVQKWLSRGSSPSLAAAGRLALAYGPEILAAAWGEAPEWLTTAAMAEEESRLAAEAEVIDRRLTQIRATL